MLNVLVVDKKKTSKGSLSDLKKSKFTILDCTKPTHKELQDISKFIDIPMHELKESYSSDTRAHSQDVGNYFELVFKCSDPTKDKVMFETVGFFASYTKNNVILLHDKKIPALKRALDLDEQTLLFHYKNGKARILFRMIAEILNEADLTLDKIEEKIDTIEKGVFKKSDHKFLSDVFEQKKIMTLFQKEFVANREALNTLGFGFNQSKQNANEIADLKSDCAQIIDRIGIFRELLNGTMEVHLAVMSNNMNIIMKRLTSLGALIIVPTLIASIYGMNFEYMPELEWKWGYFVVLGAMLIVAITLFIIFRKKDWI